MPDSMKRISCFLAAAVTLSAQSVEKPLRSVTDPGVITTRQNIFKTF